MQERQARVLPDALPRFRVHQVPRAADVRVGNVVEAGEEALERLEGHGAVRIAVRRVDLLVLGFVRRRYVPVEAVAQAGRVVVIFDPLECGLPAGERAGRLHEVGFGLWDQPVGQRGGYICRFLLYIVNYLLAETTPPLHSDRCVL